MNSAWETVAIAGWAVLVINLLLTLRLVRWLRSYQEATRLDETGPELPELPELAIGERAPAFQTRDLNSQVVRSEEFLGTEIAFVFVSPHCAPCRREMPGLITLAITASKSGRAEIILVSDSSIEKTESWLTSIRDEDGVHVNMRVLVARYRTSEFQAHYNPRSFTPYFCHIDAAGVVTARGGLHTPAWAAIARKWDSAVRPYQEFRRYR